MKNYKTISLLSILFLIFFGLGNFAWAEGEFPPECYIGGGGIGWGAQNADDSSGLPLIGGFIKVAMGISVPTGYSDDICAFEGGQGAITDPQGNFLPVVGFPETPSVPMIFRDLDENLHPGPLTYYSPEIEVRCEDAELFPEPGCSGDDCPMVPRIRGTTGYGYGTIGGVPLDSAWTYFSYPPQNIGPGSQGGWAYTIDSESYEENCGPLINDPHFPSNSAAFVACSISSRGDFTWGGFGELLVLALFLLLPYLALNRKWLNKGIPLFSILFLGFLLPTNFAFADNEFPPGCFWGGGGIGWGAQNADGSPGPALIGSSIKVAMGISVPTGYGDDICAFEGGQGAITDPQGNFLPVVGFPGTPTVPMVFRDQDENLHPGELTYYSAEIEVRCEDADLYPEPGCFGDDCPMVPRIRGETGYGSGNIAGVTLERAWTYFGYPPANIGPGSQGGWAYTIDTQSYEENCLP